jgi:hypothetical protein
VALIAAGAVVLLVSQSNVSTHINRTASASNNTTTNKGGTSRTMRLPRGV